MGCGGSAVTVLGDIYLVPDNATLRLVEFQRSALTYNVTVSASATVNIVVPAKLIDSRPGTAPVVVGIAQGGTSGQVRRRVGGGWWFAVTIVGPGTRAAI